MDPVRTLRQIAFQLERSGAPMYRVRAFLRAAQVATERPVKRAGTSSVSEASRLPELRL